MCHHFYPAMAGKKITFLGTGTSVGIPAIGCGCAVCRSGDPRDRRLRCSLWVREPGASWIVDTGPDLRAQCLRAGITAADAVILSHPHTDHIMGFDDLRRFPMPDHDGLPVHASPVTLEMLEKAFSFAFHPRARWPGYLHPRPLPIVGPFRIGTTNVLPFPVVHGATPTLGFRFDCDGGPSVAYLSDAKSVGDEALEVLRGVDVLICDALRFLPHPTHMNFAEALALSGSLGCPQTYFTHISCDVCHAEAEKDLPAHVQLAYDTLELAFP